MQPTARRAWRAVSTGLGTLALSAALGVVATSPAQAGNFGSTSCAGSPRNCVSLADSSPHTWGAEGTLGNQIAGMDTAFQAAMNDMERRTDMVTTRHIPSSPGLDVLVTDYNYGFTGILGWVECLPGSAVSGSQPRVRCDRQKLRLNGSYRSYFNTAGKRRSLACHEIGHTVGLRHTSDSASCMRTPFDPDDFDIYTSAHDNAHINATY